MADYIERLTLNSGGVIGLKSFLFCSFSEVILKILSISLSELTLNANSSCVPISILMSMSCFVRVSSN